MPESDKDSRSANLAALLDNLELQEYVKLANRPGKLLLLNFICGVARGLGFTVGTAIVLTVLYQILSQIISMNIPYLTELLERFVLMVKNIQ